MAKAVINHQDRLNRCMPAAKGAKLGDVIYDLINQHNKLLAKLDLDAGVTDTTYTSLCSVTLPENR